MNHYSTLAAFLVSSIVATSAVAKDVCGYTVGTAAGVLCPLRPGDIVCLPATAKTGPCDAALRCYSVSGLVCDVRLAPKNGPQKQCPSGSRRLQVLQCSRQRPVTVRTAPEQPS